MFSTLYNFFWALFKLFWVILWILKLAWKLALAVCFFYGVLNIIFLIHKLCKYLEKEKHREMLKRHLSISINTEVMRENSYSYTDNVSLYSVNSSRRSSEEFVVTSWDSHYQVRVFFIFENICIRINMNDSFQNSDHEDDGYIAAYRTWSVFRK